MRQCSSRATAEPEGARRAQHHLSNRASCSFVPVHCGRFRRSCSRASFGHVRGAFTGAIAAAAAPLPACGPGHDLSRRDRRDERKLPGEAAAASSKTARSIRSAVIPPPPHGRARWSPRRIATCTPRVGGTFREDSCTGLDVVRIHLPALRERREDIPLIAMHFLAQSAATNDREQVEAWRPETARAHGLRLAGQRPAAGMSRAPSLLSRQPGSCADRPSRPDRAPAPTRDRSGRRCRSPRRPPTGPGTSLACSADFYQELETFRRHDRRALEARRRQQARRPACSTSTTTTPAREAGRGGWQTGPEAEAFAPVRPGPGRPGGTARRGSSPGSDHRPGVDPADRGIAARRPKVRPEPVFPCPRCPGRAPRAGSTSAGPVAGVHVRPRRPSHSPAPAQRAGQDSLSPASFPPIGRKVGGARPSFFPIPAVRGGGRPSARQQRRRRAEGEDGSFACCNGVRGVAGDSRVSGRGGIEPETFPARTRAWRRRREKDCHRIHPDRSRRRLGVPAARDREGAGRKG